MKWNSEIQTAFAVLITLQFVVVTAHDLVDIPGWTHGSQVRRVVGRGKLWIATVVNSIFPGAAVALAAYFWNRRPAVYAKNYWLLYCGVTVLLAITMWYLPYFFGTSEERKREYVEMYAGTRQAFPPRGDNPRPNLVHVCFHILFAVNLVLVVMLRFRNP